jgi:hypothetical protein
MKLTTLLLAFAVLVFTSCTTAYKTGQTPDDVYYSAAKPQEDVVKNDKDEEEATPYDEEYYDDRYLRMKVHNRTRWNELNDWYYYDKYSYVYSYYYGSHNNPYNSWNYYYNPYCCCHYSVSPQNPKVPIVPPVIRRNFSLAGYTNPNNNNTNQTGTYKPTVRSTKPVYNNNNRSLSEKVKNIVDRDNGTSTRTYTPSSSSSTGNNNSGSNSGSGNSGGSSGGTVTRPGRN